MKLYPCPCCGSTDIEEEDCSNMQTNGTRIACNDCGLQVEGYGASDCTRKAIRAWNRREYEARILAQRDMLEDLVSRIAAYLENNPDNALVETLWLSETTSILEECQIALAELDKEKQQ